LNVLAVPSERLHHKIDTLFFLRFLVAESFLRRTVGRSLLKTLGRTQHGILQIAV